jgi:hypothetical protein
MYQGGYMVIGDGELGDVVKAFASMAILDLAAMLTFSRNKAIE